MGCCFILRSYSACVPSARQMNAEALRRRGTGASEISETPDTEGEIDRVYSAVSFVSCALYGWLSSRCLRSLSAPTDSVLRVNKAIYTHTDKIKREKLVTPKCSGYDTPHCFQRDLIDFLCPKDCHLNSPRRLGNVELSPVVLTLILYSMTMGFSFPTLSHCLLRTSSPRVDSMFQAM